MICFLASFIGAMAGVIAGWLALYWLTPEPPTYDLGDPDDPDI